MCSLRGMASVGLPTLLLATAYSQISPVPQADPYRGFVGTWRGDNSYYRKDGIFAKPALVHEPVEMIATEDPDGREVSVAVTYGTKGKKGYAKAQKHIRFDPAHEMAFLTYETEPAVKYRTIGLAEFCKGGIGRFTLSGPVSRYPQTFNYHGRYELSADEWNYTWEDSTDGVNYKPVGSFQMKRVARDTPAQ